MDKTYSPKAIEQRWYQTWEQNKYFSPSGKNKSYCIMLPPPNVTGSLHMGHGFGFSLIDILIRYHRMLGENTLWQGGTDHAGIATQMIVERRLLQTGQTRFDLGRKAFVEKIWEWKEESGNHITQQLRRLGASLDWSRERFTMDETLSEAVQTVFIRLYEEGLIYRGTRLVNWDPALLTAISDLEVISTEEEGKLFYIRYPLADQSGHIIVATTRPETLLGDVAVAVHPEDERYQHLIGKTIQLPLTDRTIPIIADEFVEKSFGSGCVKITPAHDFNDYAFAQRHDLTPINIFTPDAHLNNEVPKTYQGLERFAAREKIINDLTVLGLIEKTEKHLLKIPRGDRSGVVIEPYLTPQWFVKMQPLAEPAIAAVKKGDVRFVPENWSKTYFQWLENIEDWCISRQLWWGHRIPAWYDREGNVYVGESEAAIRHQHQLSDEVTLTQDNDVLDTWFSSALWPFSSLGWPEKTEEFNTFFPTQVLVTGFDIIFFWVARMIMMSLKFTGQVPFKEVYITGLIRDSEGQKMSKSKGNVVDPLDLIDGITLDALIQKRTQSLMQPSMAQKIEKATRQQFPQGISPFGTDALRFTFCALASSNREIRFDLNRLEGYRNFCNKLWNAGRYVLMNVEGKTLDPHPTSLPDLWILSHLQTIIATVHEQFSDYRFDFLAQTLYEFVWNEFCDWYLELAKPLLTQPDEEAAKTRYVLVTVYEQILRLLHPIMPFITEEIWQRIAPLANASGKMLMLEAYPEVNSALKNVSAETELAWIKNIIVGVRTLRSEMNIAPGKFLSILLHKGTMLDKQYFSLHENLIKTLAKISDAHWVQTEEPIPQCATVLVGELEILIPMEGLIDKAEESQRLTKEINKLMIEVEKAQAKLQNPLFIHKAPAAVVEQERKRLEEFTGALQKLQQKLNEILT